MFVNYIRLYECSNFFYDDKYFESLELTVIYKT